MKHDVFLRADSFQAQPWYDEFQIFLHIGICKPKAEHREAIKDALERMGHTPVERVYNDAIYIAGES